MSEFTEIGRSGTTIDFVSLGNQQFSQRMTSMSSYTGLDKAENATMDIRKLLRFINSKVTQRFPDVLVPERYK